MIAGLGTLFATAWGFLRTAIQSFRAPSDAKLSLPRITRLGLQHGLAIALLSSFFSYSQYYPLFNLRFALRFLISSSQMRWSLIFSSLNLIRSCSTIVLCRLLVEDYVSKEKPHSQVPLYHASIAMAGGLALAAVRPFAPFWVVPMTFLASLHGFEALRKSAPQ